MGVIGMRSKPPRPIKYIYTKALLIFVIGMQKKSSIYPELNDRDWLNGKYWGEELGSQRIANIIGCSKPTVRSSLKRLSIPTRKPNEQIKQLQDKEWLYNKYWGEERNCTEIGEIVGCNPSTVYSALRRHNITTRSVSEAHQGEKGCNWGKHPSEATRNKLSEANRGEKNYFYGKHFTGEENPFYGKEHTKETKKVMQQKAKKRCESEEERKKLRKRLTANRRPTKPELIFEEICKKNNLPFRYVGDGQLWIGKKGEKQLNPDFIEANGKKIVVEVFGSYWHSPLRNFGLKKEATLSFRRAHYKKYDWQSAFIWEEDLRRRDAEAFVLSALKKEGVI